MCGLEIRDLGGLRDLLARPIAYRRCATTAQKGGHYGHLMLCSAAQEMRVWPLEAGLQEQASNHLKLLWSKATVVSVKEKSRHRIVAGEGQGAERERTTDEVSKRNGRRQNWGPYDVPG